MPDRSTLTAIARALAAWSTRCDPWTNVVGIARTLLALGTAITLTFDAPHVLFRSIEGSDGPLCVSATRAGMFCVLGDHLELARWLAVLGLLVVASGWRPRLTAPLHWWITASYQANALVVDGGDQVAAVLTLLLLPVALTDDRVWHWWPSERRVARPHAALVAMSAHFVIRLQVAGIYFHAAVGKIGVEEWLDGTATYYIFSDPMFGPPPWLQSILLPVVQHPLGVASLTWGTILLEILLFAALFMEKRWWRPLMLTGMVFHASIALTHGLISFMFAMWAALLLYLWPLERALDLRRWRSAR